MQCVVDCVCSVVDLCVWLRRQSRERGAGVLGMLRRSGRPFCKERNKRGKAVAMGDRLARDINRGVQGCVLRQRVVWK